MRRTPTGLVILTLAVSAIGAVDAARDSRWVQALLFATVACLQAAILTSTGRRATVSLRPDLAQWLSNRSQDTGESVDDVTDRAVAWYRHGLYQPDSTHGG